MASIAIINMDNHLTILIKNVMKYSASLKRKSLYLDKPWTMIDGDFEIQKLIFKSNGELLIIKNGKVQTGAWELVLQGDSIIIDRNEDKIMLNEVFLDEGVLILKLDGTNHQFYVFANTNVVPDLDIHRYLKKLSYVELNVRTFKLHGGKELEVYESHSNHIQANFGNKVSINGDITPDGLYLLESTPFAVSIKDSKISDYLRLKEFVNNSRIFHATVRSFTGLTKGDRIWVNGEIPENGDYTLSKNISVSVANGMIMKVNKKSFIKRLFK